MTTLEEFGSVEIEIQKNQRGQFLHIESDDKSPRNYNNVNISLETGKVDTAFVEDEDGFSRLNRIQNAFNEIVEKVENKEKI